MNMHKPNQKGYIIYNNKTNTNCKFTSIDNVNRALRFYSLLIDDVKTIEYDEYDLEENNYIININFKNGDSFTILEQ